MRTVAVIGNGRAGGSLAGALRHVGWDVQGPWGRGEQAAVVEAARAGADLVLLAVPDGSIADVSRTVAAQPGTVIAHVAGSLTLDVLAPHERRASLHPLVSMPNPEVGAARLAAGAWFAVAGSDPAARALLHEVVSDLHGHAVDVADADRARYHATACIASNHLVALLGQVERLASSLGVPLEAFSDLAAASLANVVELGPAAALTGPVARGDEATVAAHLAALPPEEVAAYVAMADQARRLAGRAE